MLEPRKQLPPSYRVVLDWLCRQPARVFDFADVADALKMKRGEIEKIIGELRHQRWGAPLALVGPGNIRLRPRHAFLPHDSKFRAGFPPVEAPSNDVPEHSTIIAMKRAEEEAKAEAARAAADERKIREERGAVWADYQARKKAAREKAEAEKPKKGEDPRFRSGFAEQNDPIGVPAAPLAPSAALPKKLELPNALQEIADGQPPAPTYKKKDAKGGK
jgi:hypothetical protein